jgi:hypothetical protein
LLVLFVEVSMGVPDASSFWFAGWCGTAMLVRAWLAVEKSAEAVLPAGIAIAGKGRTRSRGDRTPFVGPPRVRGVVDVTARKVAPGPDGHGSGELVPAAVVAEAERGPRVPSRR